MPLLGSSTVRIGSATPTAMWRGGVQIWTATPQPTYLLRDTFTSLSAWNVPAGVTVTGGQMVLPYRTSYTEAVSKSRYDLTAACFEVQVVTAQTVSPYDAYLHIKSDTNNMVSIILSGGSMTGRVRNSGVATNQALGAYNATSRAFWRIRDGAGVFHFDASPDGVTWTMLGQVTRTWEPTSCTVAIEASAWQAAAAANLVVDNANVVRYP